jgi:hypothetical protein
MRMFLTALSAALATAVLIGGARTALAHTIWGDHLIQGSCAPASGPLRGFCVQRHTYPGIPLLRDERRTVEIRPDGSPRMYLVADPFWSAVEISWRDDGVSLTDQGGYSLTFSERLLRSIGA